MQENKALQTPSAASAETNLSLKTSTNDTGPKQLNATKSSHQVIPLILLPPPFLGKALTVAPEPEHNAGYDADFFADNDTGGFGDVDDGETFADARETFSPGAADRSTALPDGTQNEEFGSLLRARRARPDYVNYAKTAKKVDVKKLKDNLWTKLDLEVASHLPTFPFLP